MLLNGQVTRKNKLVFSVVHVSNGVGRNILAANTRKHVFVAET